jgi:hypothetical protein
MAAEITAAMEITATAMKVILVEEMKKIMEADKIHVQVLLEETEIMMIEIFLNAQEIVSEKDGMT